MHKFKKILIPEAFSGCFLFVFSENDTADIKPAESSDQKCSPASGQIQGEESAESFRY